MALALSPSIRELAGETYGKVSTAVKEYMAGHNCTGELHKYHLNKDDATIHPRVKALCQR